MPSLLCPVMPLFPSTTLPSSKSLCLDPGDTGHSQLRKYFYQAESYKEKSLGGGTRRREMHAHYHFSISGLMGNTHLVIKICQVPTVVLEERKQFESQKLPFIFSVKKSMKKFECSTQRKETYQTTPNPDPGSHWKYTAQGK